MSRSSKFKPSVPNLSEEIKRMATDACFLYNEFCKKLLHHSTVDDYISIFSIVCDFKESFNFASCEHLLGSSSTLSKEVASLTQEFWEFFMVQRLNKNHGSQNSSKKYQVLEAFGFLLRFLYHTTSFAVELKNIFRVPMLMEILESENCVVKKHELVEVFISFLLRLLYRKTDLIVYSLHDRIDNLEKELRFLLIVLGDMSWMLCDDDEHEEFQLLLPEFVAVANEAGSLVNSLLFSVDLEFGKIYGGRHLAVFLSHIYLLKVRIIKLLNILSSNSISAYKNPETPLVVSLPIVDALICDLEHLMQRDDNQIAGLKDQMEILHQGLLVLKSSIKDIGLPQLLEIGELKEPLMRIGDMAHAAEYLIASFLVGDAPLLYLITRLRDISQRIDLIVNKLIEFTKKYKSGGLKMATYSSARPSLQAKGNTDADDITVGFEGNTTNYMLDQLEGGTQCLQVILICGMAGIGKTTLAKKLYNHPIVDCRFDKLSWCVVSQTCQRKNILTGILIHIASKLGEDKILKMEEESLIEHIYKTLKGRRYLIVIDDIWDSNVWDDLGRCFPDDGNGSRILFTSRNKDVAPPNSIIYALPPLSNGQCWDLLEKKVFRNKSCPLELLGIGKRIAANCRGLPLAVVVVGGILSTVDRKRSTWEEVERNLVSYIFSGGDNSVMQILELSFKHLPYHLKPCFLYCGAFAEDEDIVVRKLMRLWIAEGFVCKKEGTSAEDVAEEYFMELIDKSLVTVSKRRSDGGIKTCVIHDLLRDLCLKVSEEENFQKFIGRGICSKCKNVRRLLIEGRITMSCFLSSTDHVLASFACNVRDMRLMRVLDFNYIRNHYIGIEFLVNMRYLVVGYNLPPSVGSLVNLEYLHVQRGKEVHLPPTIVKMKRLRYIHARFGAIYDKDCDSSQPNNLEYLSGIIIESLKDEEMLKCSPRLRKLKCRRFRLSSMEEREYRHLDLSFLTQLESLNVQFHVPDGLLRFSFPSNIQRLSFPSNIKKLTLYGLRLPGETISAIGRLQNLEILKLGFFAVEGERWETRDDEFQKLKFLKMELTSLSQWNVESSQHFPRLERLILIGCHNLEEIPSEISELATLEMIEVRGGRTSLVKSAERIQQEQWEMGNQEFRLILTDY